MKSVVRENHLRNIGRQTFVDLVNSRTDFSKQTINQVVEQFETFWQQILGQQQQKAPQAPDPGVLNYLKSAQPDELKSSQLPPKLEKLIEATSKQQAAQQAEAVQKVAETAAWWLFGTAFVSAAASAMATPPAIARRSLCADIAGTIAVRGW